MDSQGQSRCGRRRSIDFYSDLLDSFNQIVKSKNDFNSNMNNLLHSSEWQSFVTEYGHSSVMFSYLEKLTVMGERCDTSVMKTFLESCGYLLALWVIENDILTSFLLILKQAARSKLNLCTDTTRFKMNPIVSCLYHGKWSNVHLLLSYGYNLEQEDNWSQELLVECVFSEIATSSERRIDLKKVTCNPYKKRCFLICLMIRTYLYEHDFPYIGCDAALRSIWRHLPDSYLTKDEFVTILQPFPANLYLLSKLYDRYINTVCNGDISLVQQPRTLAHCSRCTVRQMLGTNFSLPDGVHKLPIPAKLKNYLLFK